jgi:hypothetical protein
MVPISMFEYTSSFDDTHHLSEQQKHNNNTDTQKKREEREDTQKIKIVYIYIVMPIGGLSVTV